jgi:hypothetical protein
MKGKKFQWSDSKKSYIAMALVLLVDQLFYTALYKWHLHFYIVFEWTIELIVKIISLENILTFMKNRHSSKPNNVQIFMLSIT